MNPEVFFQVVIPAVRDIVKSRPVTRTWNQKLGRLVNLEINARTPCGLDFTADEIEGARSLEMFNYLADVAYPNLCEEN